MLRLSLLALALALIAIFIACGPSFEPEFEPLFDCFGHPESAPIIAVAEVVPNTESIIGGPVKTKSVSVTPVVLCKVTMKFENVIKGSVPLADADVFYFSAQMPHGPGPIGFSGPATSREMLILRREHGKLRMGMDITSACEAGVFSGTHPGYKPRTGEPVREQMIDLFLTPGIGATELGMIHAIFDWIPPDVSPEYTAKTLSKLAASPSPVIRAAACLQFRDLVAGRFPALAIEFGVPPSDLKRWQEEEQQNSDAKFWWGGGPMNYAVPKGPLHVGNLTGMDLCTNDEALGVPPLRPNRDEVRPVPLPLALH
jgi:hypothetical protein